MLSSGCSEMGTGSSNSPRSATQSQVCGILQGMRAKSPPVGAMRPAHRRRRELRCRVMPHHFNFLSVGEEFGADACNLANATQGGICGYRGGARSEYRETQRRNNTNVPATECSAWSSASAIRAAFRCAG
jgi:hypothetical protein